MPAYSHIKVCISLQQLKLFQEITSLFKKLLPFLTLNIYHPQVCAYTPLHFTLACLYISLRILIAPLVSSNSSLHDYLKSYMERFMMICFIIVFFFCHCIACPSLIYGFWLSPVWYSQAFRTPFWHQILC